MNRSKAKGTTHETNAVKWFRENGFPEARRETLHGSKDVGDIGGVSWRGIPIVIEVKNCREKRHALWLKEAEAERVNAGAPIAFVITHTRGVGEKNYGENECLIDLRSLAKLLDISREIDGYAIMPLRKIAELLRGEK